MFKRILNKKSFTLSELLLTLALLGVLVIVAIIVFNKYLEKGREDKDISNLRAAKSAALTLYTEDDTIYGTYYYDAQKSKLISSFECEPNSIEGYGEGTRKEGDLANIFHVDIIDDGIITLSWIDPDGEYDETIGDYTADMDVKGKIIKIVFNGGTP